MNRFFSSRSEQPVWVLLHGWGSDRTLWRELLTRLPGDTLVLDLPGFGLARDETADTWEQYLDRLARQLPQHCIMVGWSLGGMLATQLAARCPERVHGLVTLACNPSFITREGWPSAMDAEVFSQFCISFDEQPAKTWSRFCALQCQGDRARKSVQQILKQQASPTVAVLPSWRQLLKWLAQIDNRQVLMELACPSVHLFGEGDALVPPSAAPAVAQLGRAVTHLFPERGHGLHLADPQAVSATILAWLESQRRISKASIAHSFSAAVATYDAAAHVQRQVAKQLIDDVGELEATDRVLDLGCGTGFVSEILQSRHGGPQTLCVDLAEAMVVMAQQKLPGNSGVVADAEHLPFAAESLHAVLSSLALQWCHNLTQVGCEVHRCLRPGGRFVFSTLGPATLHELKAAWRQVDDYVHVNEFKSLEQVRRELTESGLVVESVRIMPMVPRYRQLSLLLQELKAIGAHNLNPGRKLGLSRRSVFKQLEQAYQIAADEQGLLPATYEVFMISAKKP